MNNYSKEKKIIMPFYSYVHLNKNTIQDTYLLKWKYGTQVLAKYDTCYDSDNELDFDNPNYDDFMSFIVRVKKLNSFDSRDGFKEELLKKEGVLFEFNYHSFPNEIYNSKGELISKRD